MFGLVGQFSGQISGGWLCGLVGVVFTLVGVSGSGC